MEKDISGWIGFEFAPFSFVIERGKIREFVQAIGDDNPLYVSQNTAKERGYQDVPVPLTFATVVDMWGDLDFFKQIEVLNLNLLKVLHGEQEYEYFGDMYPGDTLTVHVRVTDTTVKHGSSGGMNLFTLESSYKKDGETVLIARSVVVERH